MVCFYGMFHWPLYDMVCFYGMFHWPLYDMVCFYGMFHWPLYDMVCFYGMFHWPLYDMVCFYGMFHWPLYDMVCFYGMFHWPLYGLFIGLFIWPLALPTFFIYFYASQYKLNSILLLYSGTLQPWKYSTITSRHLPRTLSMWIIIYIKMWRRIFNMLSQICLMLLRNM